MRAAKFLHMLHIYRIFDLPYKSQIVPLASILADIGDAWEHDSNRATLIQWYWNGVFGELYGSAVETRIARDFMEVPPWLNSGPPPSAIGVTDRNRLVQIFTDRVTAQPQLARHLPDARALTQNFVSYHVHLIHAQHPRPPALSARFRALRTGV